MRLFSYLSIFIFLAACASSKQGGVKNDRKNAKAVEKREQNLTEEYAMLRSKAVSSVSYKLHIELKNDSETFSGNEQVQFNLSEIPQNLHLDFRDGLVEQLVINEKEIKEVSHSGGKLQLPENFLKIGSNKINIRYSQKFSKDGRGFYRFKDTEDNRVYTWTQFEAFDANHFLPCFDQPDLKATFQMTVSAPTDWHVITTTMEKKVEKQKNQKVWFFAETPKMSTYLLSLHAGPYKVWSSKAESIPLRLFSRQSLAKHVRPDFWFEITKKGLKFFGDYFAYPYPFKKYDQVIAPDFGSGAMENIAAVTFSERYIKRGRETNEEKLWHASVILHEMAHMWFGNLVTMKWWNGLWLNESFATYMAALSLTKATDFKVAWLAEQNSGKQWAYTEDQWVTTHPINGKVPDIESTFTNFDGITYGKGAAVLKQLAFNIGDSNFREGLRFYFKKHQYQNTSLQDFISALETASKKNLQSWAAAWLEKKGLDTTKISFQCEDNKISSATISVTPPIADSVQREHATQIGLYDFNQNKLILRKSIAFHYSGSNTELKELKGESCPAFINPNNNDYDYVKIHIDEQSLKTAVAHLNDIHDNMTRQMVWNDLVQMLRDKAITTAQFVNVLLKYLPEEKYLPIVQQVSRSIDDAIYFLPNRTEQEKQWRLTTISKIEQMMLTKLKSAPPYSDEQKTWLDRFVQIAETEKSLNYLENILTGSQKIKGLELDQDRRWNIVVRLNSFATKSSQALLKKEMARDATETGIKSSLSAQAARPDEGQKFQLIHSAIAANSDLSFSRKRAIFRSALPDHQPKFREQFSNDFYSQLLTMIKEGRDSSFLKAFISLTPTTCDENSFNKLNSFIDKNSDKLVPTVLKSLKISRQEEERCIGIRQMAMKDKAL